MPKEKLSGNDKIGERFSRGPLLKSIGQLDQKNISSEKVWRVKDTRIVYINYKLLQHDFPQLKNEVLKTEYPHLKCLKGLMKQRAIETIIEDWLIRNTAFISSPQAKQARVNTKIPIGKENVKAFRPPGYGRALVFSIEENDRCLKRIKGRNKPPYENRLIDVKGIGVAPGSKPRTTSHSNGINRLGLAILELVMQELLHRIFVHSNTRIQTLPVYGILDLGFDEKNKGKPGRPAGLIARRAHRRPKDSGGLYPYASAGQHLQVEIESLLRKYGITSVNNVTRIRVGKEKGKLQIHYGEQQIDFFNEQELKEIERVSHYKDGMNSLHFDGINIQHTREIGLNPFRATLVDFQSYTVHENFKDPLLCLVSDRLLRWGGTIWPGYDDFILPDKLLRIPYEMVSGKGKIWGYDMGEDKIKIFSLCYGLTEDFRNKLVSREMLMDTLQIYLKEITRHLY